MKICCIIVLLLVALVESATAQYRDIAWVRGGHGTAVLSHDISPDGRLLVTGSADGTVKLWEIATANLLGTLRGHRNVVTAVAFSPDGSSVVSGSLDSTVRFWDVATGKEQRIIDDEDSVTAIVHAPTINRLVTRQVSGNWKVRDLGSEAVVATFAGSNGPGNRYAWFADGTLVATGREGDSTIQVWNVKTGSIQTTVTVTAAGITALAFSPDGKTLASGIFDDTVRLWNVMDGTLQRTVGGPIPLHLGGLLFSPGGDSIYVTMQGVVEVWRIDDNSKVKEYELDITEPDSYPLGSSINVQGLSVHPDGQHLIKAVAAPEYTGEYTSYIDLLSLDTGESIRDFIYHRSTVRVMGFLDTILLSFERYSGIATEMNGTRASRTDYLPASGEFTNLSSDGSFSSSSTGRGESSQHVQRYDNRQRGRSTMVRFLAGEAWDVLPSWVSPGGRHVCFGFDAVILWDSLDGPNTRLHVFDPGPRSVAAGAVAFSTDARLLAMIQSDHVLLWNIPGNTTERTLPVTSPVTLAFSRDGSYMAAGSTDGTIIIWESATGTVTRTLSGHRGTVHALTFCKDDLFLVSAGADSTVRTWSVETGINDYTFDEYPSSQISVAVTLDGQHIASGTEDGSIIMWQARGALASVEAELEHPASSPTRLDCYPTPSGSVVHIECKLTRAERVEVRVTDQLGREVAVVADGEYESGVHRFTWDAGALPAGIYHCRLKAGSEMVTRRIVVVR